ALTGIPTTAGAFTFTVRAMDANKCAGSQSYTLTITGCPPITLSPASLPNAGIGVPYNQTVTASGGTAPYTFSITSGTLPTGISLSSSGQLLGRATTAGTFTFTIRATDAATCNGNQSYTIRVSSCGTITLSPATLPAGTIGIAYSQTITATG